MYNKIYTSFIQITPSFNIVLKFRLAYKIKYELI
jgi:hypothetical protein